MNIARKGFLFNPNMMSHNSSMNPFCYRNTYPTGINFKSSKLAYRSCTVSGKERLTKCNRNQMACFCESDPASGEITGWILPLPSVMKVQWTKALIWVFYSRWDCYGACPHSVTQLRWERSIFSLQRQKEFEKVTINVSTYKMSWEMNRDFI